MNLKFVPHHKVKSFAPMHSPGNEG